MFLSRNSSIFVAGMRIIQDYDLTASNTFRMKVRCACYVEYDNARELETIDWDALPKPVKHIGGGSNLLFTKDFPGTILHCRIDYIKYVDMGLDDVPVMAGAGARWDDFVNNTCGHGLWGAENLSLIPGEVGAAAVQNIGAYGVEVKDIISGVVCYDFQEHKKVRFSVGECGYGYRESMFKNTGDRYAVTAVLFRLSRKYRPRLDYKGIRQALGLADGENPDNLTPMKVRDAIIKVRREKLPDPEEIGSAGSFFKNPVVSALDFSNIIDVSRRDFGPDVVIPHFINPDGSIKIPAAWLIDRCGFKGSVCGGAACYEKQPLVIVNSSGDAAPGDILSLESSIVSAVKARFGVELQPEVEHI